MSDVLPQIEPETSGRVTKLDVPLSKYLSNSFAAGQDDSMFHAVSSLTEDHLANNPNNSKTLTADEANAKYAIGDLKFTNPLTESLASTMAEREKAKMDQQTYLSSGATRSRFLPGMAAGILGATANPLDFGSMFIPFVGEGKIAAEAGVVGKMLSRGLISAEAIARTGIPVPKLIGSMVQAGMWQGMAEIPKVMQAHFEDQPMPHIGADELGQMALAGIFHGIGEGLKLLRPETHDAMVKQATNDFLEDKDTSAHQYIPLDEHIIAFKAMEHEIQLRHEADGSIDFNKIAEDYKDKNLEYAVAAAIRSAPDSTGQQQIHTGLAHWVIPQAFEDGAERGMWTNRGRFVTQDEAGELHGLPPKSDPTSEQLLYGTEDMDALGPDEKKIYQGLVDTGMTDAQAMTILRKNINERMVNHFMSQERVKADIENLRQEAISKWVDDKKKELANPVPKEVTATANKETVPREVVEKYNGDQDHLNKSLDEDIEGLAGEKPEKLDVNPDFEKHQELVKQLKGKTLDEAQPIAKKIEELKNKYGGEVPPEKMPVPNAIDTAVNCLLQKLL